MGTNSPVSLTYKQRFIKNLSLLYLATFISKVFALAINIILVRKLGASIYGAYGFALTFVTYFTLIADSGLSIYGESAIAKNKNGLKEIVGNVFSFNLFMSLISSAALVLSAVYVLRFGAVQTYMLLVIALLPLANTFSLSFAIKALEKNQIIALSAFIGRFIYFLGIILFVVDKGDYLYSIIFFIAGAFITAFIQFGYVIKIIGRIKLNFSLKNFKYLALNGIPFGIFSALVIFYGSLPVLFLKILSTNKNTGYFYMAGRLVFFVSSFTALIVGAFIPIISDAIKNKDLERQSSILSELFRFNYTALIPVCIGGVVLSKNIVYVFFGPKYITSAYILDIMIWSILFIGISAVFNGYLTALQERKSLIVSALIATVAGLLATPVLIKYFGVYGGAAASVITELITAFALIALTLKSSRARVNVDWINLTKVLFASLLMGIIINFMAESLSFNPVTNLIVCISAGIIIYFILSVALKIIKIDDLNELRGIVKYNYKFNGAVEDERLNYIYIDITDTLLNGLNTGIQRVVRNIVKRISIIEKATGMRVVPVIVKNKKLVKAASTAGAIFEPFQQSKSLDTPHRLKKAYIKWESKINLYLAKFDRFDGGSRRGIFLKNSVYKYVYIRLFLRKMFIYYAYISLRFKGIKTGGEIKPKEGDIILFPDVFWTYFYDINEIIKKYKPFKAKIVQAVYDVIPVMYEDYCNRDFVSVFRLRLDELLKNVDLIITVSKSEAENIKYYAGIKDAAGIVRVPVDYFYPGFDHWAEFTLKPKDKNHKNPERAIRNVFKKFYDNRNIFLMVGTLTPVKNHMFVLSAFEKLWKSGFSGILVIIGKIDKTPADLLQNIKSSSFLGINLFFFEDVTDEELNYIYGTAKVLIAASVAEGLGLPLIEGLSKNLKIIASDIPVFKEIATEAGIEKGGPIFYFKQGDEEDFIETVKAVFRMSINETFGKEGVDGAAGKHDDKNGVKGVWLTWDESVIMLSNKIK